MEFFDENFLDLQRTKHNLTLSEIAVKINMTPQQLAIAICEPEKHLTLKQVCDIAQILRCNPCFLFTEPERIQCIPRLKNKNFFEEKEAFYKTKHK